MYRAVPAPHQLQKPVPLRCGRCYTGPDTYGILTLDEGKVTAYEHKEVPHQ